MLAYPVMPGARPLNRARAFPGGVRAVKLSQNQVPVYLPVRLYARPSMCPSVYLPVLSPFSKPELPRFQPPPPNPKPPTPNP